MLRYTVGAHAGVIRIITNTQFRASRAESTIKSFRKEESRKDFTEAEVDLRLAS